MDRGKNTAANSTRPVLGVDIEISARNEHHVAYMLAANELNDRMVECHAVFSQGGSAFPAIPNATEIPPALDRVPRRRILGA